MIFRRLHALGADWIYCFPEMYLVELARVDNLDTPGDYDVTESPARTLRAHRDRAEVEQPRGQLAAIHEQARQDALDQLPPDTVRGYRQVYGRDPRGWPPA